MNYSEPFLNKIVTVVIDRPLGTKHPKWDFYYPVNYGYLQGVKAPDSEDLDAYVLGVFEPKETYTGICIAIIHRTNDDDDKLIVVPEGKNFTDEQIRALTEFQEGYFESNIIRGVKK